MKEALEASRERGIISLVEAFEAIAGRYPEPVRALYLRSDAAAMRAAWAAAIADGAVSVRLGEWRVPCLIYVAAGDADFYDEARRAADEIPSAEFLTLGGTDHLGMDTADIDPVYAAVLRTLVARDSGVRANSWSLIADRPVLVSAVVESRVALSATLRWRDQAPSDQAVAYARCTDD